MSEHNLLLLFLLFVSNEIKASKAHTHTEFVCVRVILLRKKKKKQIFVLF